MHRALLPQLEIVSLRSLILHEDVEAHRVDRIVNRFRTEALLKNPPIVGRSPRHRRRIVLDGASRITAARRLGFQHFLVQVVPYPSSEIGLDPWHHVVVGMSWKTLVDKASRIPGAKVETMSWTLANKALENRTALACICSPGKRAAVLGLIQRRRTGFKPLRELTRLYAADPGLHRIREDQLPLPREWLGEERVLVIFPRFRQEEIVRLALRHEDRLPMGITRHTLPNRALRVQYPLAKLRGGDSLAEKRRYLRKFLERRWEQGGIRHYPDPTTVYDE